MSEIITTKKELMLIMSKMIKSKRNRWFKSNLGDEWYFWNVEGKEIGSTFPVIYAKLSLLESTARKLSMQPNYLSLLFPDY